MSSDRPSKRQGRGLFSRWLRALCSKYAEPPRDRSQLMEQLRAAEASNVIDPETLTMLEGALQVSEMRVRDIMVPRSQIVVVNEDEEPGDYALNIVESGHSRFPVMDSKRDQVVGILLAKDLLSHYVLEAEERFELRDVMRPPVFVPDSKRLHRLLRELQASRNHLAIVVDEFGGTAGLITMEDVLEQIVGEIEDEFDIDEVSPIKQHSDRRFTVRAHTPIEDFNAYFGTDHSTDEHDTVGGLLLKAFGHLPKRGERMDIGDLRFEILRADRRRVLSVRVIKRGVLVDTTPIRRTA